MNKGTVKPKKEIFHSVYLRSLLTTKITLHVTEIGKQLLSNLHNKLVQKISGKCIEEGFCSSNNIKIIQHSTGSVSSEKITFHVSFECNICHPVEGMNIVAKIRSITKAGIHGQVIDSYGTIPITVFVARDHNFKTAIFHEVKENDMISVKIIGIRYELNDPFICVIASIIGLEIKTGGSNTSSKTDNSQYDVMDIIE
jgi:DNA-directed RNA polymerase subunit E'/Rpb7